jgi:hypothetical protein
MLNRTAMLTGSVVGVAMLLAAMWCWQHAIHVSVDADRPDLALWAARAAAIALAAGAQCVLLAWVVDRLFRQDLLWQVARAALMGVVALATVSAAALALASR